MILNMVSHALNVATMISFLIEIHQNRMMAFLISLLVILKGTCTQSTLKVENMGVLS